MADHRPLCYHPLMNHVYMLRCADGSLYTGWTNSLEKRLKDHGEGRGAKYTRSRLPVLLVYQEECETPTAARKREMAIKGLPRQAKLALVARYEDLLSQAREKLIAWGLKPDTLLLLREKQGIALFRLSAGGEQLVLKLFLGEFGREELFFYKLLAQAGLPTLKLLQKDETALLMADLDFSDTLAPATLDAAKDPAVMGALGAWYRALHQLEVGEGDGIGLSAEWQALSFSNLENANQVHGDKPAWRRLHPLLVDLLEQAASLPLRLCYNDFHPVNLVTGRQEALAFMMDYGRMGLNHPAVDLNNALRFSDEAGRAAFLAAYGLTWPRQETWSTLLPPLMDVLMGVAGGECALFSEEYDQALRRFIGKE